MCVSTQNNEEGNQNSDKRKTYIHARQQYRHIPVMLFVDRDELLFCPGIGDNTWDSDGQGVSMEEGPITSKAHQARFQDSIFLAWENAGIQS